MGQNVVSPKEMVLLCDLIYLIGVHKQVFMSPKNDKISNPF
jgi:hypothetical protein